MDSYGFYTDPLANWIEVVHTCPFPETIPAGVDAGSKWRCPSCETTYTYTGLGYGININSLQFEKVN